ncbi:MAG: FecR domain-containing protein [Deltaproteobacteria bacterium]|nr:FecR domain-containing protein [Deltaproteobacteria bacterium]
MKTVKCPYSPDDQVRYAYGEMEANQAAAFVGHLESCPTCLAAVSRLKEAADVCRLARQAALDEPEWKRSFTPGSIKTNKPWWHNPLVWLPVSSVACGALLWLVVWAASRPAQVEHRPVIKVAAHKRPPTQPEALAVRVVEFEGSAYLRSPREVASHPLTKTAEIFAGDRLSTTAGSWVLLQLTDGSQVRLGPDAGLKFESIGQAGDRFYLLRGAAACQVTSRAPERPFVIASDPAEAEVVGTVLAVRLMKSGVLVAGVAKGKIRMNRPACKKPPIPVQAGQQVIISKTGELLRTEALGKGMRQLMQPMLPDSSRAMLKTRPANGSRVVAKPDQKPVPDKPAGPAEPSGPIAVEPDKKLPSDSVAKIVDEVYQDTEWIFNELRNEIQRGNYKRALNRLNNYIADPESPDRSEAVYLKAVCLEKMGETRDAFLTFRKYLTKWPAGKRANKALAGQIRNRAGQ